ncbi:amino acid permease [filamentous cyanobacterium CCT1]|nr:amino acid permease [filamentous cyanobacterium CCT1]PSN81474.1 amino acid permease [filamentous cyanobacterium CCP4]
MVHDYAWRRWDKALTLNAKPVTRVEEPLLPERSPLSPEICQPRLSLSDAIALIVGLVIGAGIFETPSLVAANLGSARDILGAWIVGGTISLLGALCYAELATAYPHVGGSYHYLQLAFGQRLATLFAWARMTVIQTGSIALLAFVLGDYASQIVSLGSYSPAIYAAIAVTVLTLLNMLGLRQSKRAQTWVTSALVLGLLLVIVLGLAFTPATSAATPIGSRPTWGMALVFVMLSYGGWHEAAYLSAEIEQPRRNVARSLLWGVATITTVYVLINWAYLHSLGVSGMANSQAIAADLLRRTLGEPGALLVSLLVVLATLGSINASILTGARTSYAVGQDVSPLSFLDRWQPGTSTPTAAYLLQGAIALALVGLGTLTRQGFETMVDYTAPIFWGFFLLSTASLMVLRSRHPRRLRPFQVPLYPAIPLVFCTVCLYLFCSSLIYSGVGALVGVLVLVLGIPLTWPSRL